MRKIKHCLTRKGFCQGYVLLLKNKYLYRNVEKLKKRYLDIGLMKCLLFRIQISEKIQIRKELVEQ